MRVHRTYVLGTLVIGACSHAPAMTQGELENTVPCRDVPCAVVVDWERVGGITNLSADRRYGNPVRLAELVKARLTERGFGNHVNTSVEDELQILLMPRMGNAMCDQMPGTATDMSCRAILEIQARAQGPDRVRREIGLPSRIRNRCSTDQVMPVENLGSFVGDWIIYALEGRWKGERRPIGRC